jgi:hypothetical protein
MHPVWGEPGQQLVQDRIGRLLMADLPIAIAVDGELQPFQSDDILNWHTVDHRGGKIGEAGLGREASNSGSSRCTTYSRLECVLGQVSRWLVSLPSIPYLPGVRLCSTIVSPLRRSSLLLRSIMLMMRAIDQQAAMADQSLCQRSKEHTCEKRFRHVQPSSMVLSFSQERHMHIRNSLWLQVLLHRFIHTYEECCTRMSLCTSLLPTALCFCARQQCVLPQLLSWPAALLRAVVGQAHG